MTKQKGLLFDSTLCVGCGECYSACKTQNNLKKTSDDCMKDHLSNETYTVVEDHQGNFVRKLCMHCESPTCVSVCPVGAFQKTELGPVVYDADKCIGCRYCMQACPHSIPRYEWSSLTPRVRKCIMCSDRVQQGLPTACSEACQPGATIFGDIEDLRAEAKKRIKESPDQYFPEIFGLEEGGGTNVLVLSKAGVSFDQLGFASRLPKEALPELTANVLEKLPTVVSTGAVFLGGMYWLTKRKNEIRQEKLNNDKKESL